jgi:hypothetical protein
MGPERSCIRGSAKPRQPGSLPTAEERQDEQRADVHRGHHGRGVIDALRRVAHYGMAGDSHGGKPASRAQQDVLTCARRAAWATGGSTAQQLLAPYKQEVARSSRAPPFSGVRFRSGISAIALADGRLPDGAVEASWKRRPVAPAQNATRRGSAPSHGKRMRSASPRCPTPARAMMCSAHGGRGHRRSGQAVRRAAGDAHSRRCTCGCRLGLRC